MKQFESIGMIGLGVWLISTSILNLFNIHTSIAFLFITLLTLALGVILVLRLQEAKPILSLAMLLLVMWLILVGLLNLLNTSFPASGIVLAVIATTAGILFLSAILFSRSFHNIGLTLMGAWLIATNIFPLFSITFPGISYVLNGLAVMAGILLLIGI